MVEPYEEDYKKILEKITQDKEERQKNLDELKRRKREIEKKALIDSQHSSKPDPPQILHTQSAERKALNKKVYEHLQSPTSKLPKQLKPRHLNRFEEDDAEVKNQANSKQINKLKMLDKRARYANIVKEIFTPTIDPAKRQEVDGRNEKNKTRSAYNSRGNSPEPPAETLAPSLSQTNLRNTNALMNAAKQTLSPRNYP